MAEAEKKGKTLWEMLVERVKGNGNGHGATISFRNPRDLRVGSRVPVSFVNGPEFVDFDFTVNEIREYVRRIGGQEFGFTDYVLRGVNTKSFDADDVIIARLRALPNQAGGHDSLLLRLHDEFAFAENFLGVLKDPSGILDMTEDSTGVTDSFDRINELREPYEAAVLIISETTADGQVPPGKTSSAKLEYWDFWRDMDIGGGHTGKEFVFVEMNSDTGWFQIWRGREFFS
jgi:hypothetical protein